MKITKANEKLVAKNNLEDLEIEELALVASGNIPVNPGATITFIKSQPDEETLNEEDVKLFSRFVKSLRGKFAPAEAAQDENPELAAALAKQAELQKAMEDNAAEIEKAKASKNSDNNPDDDPEDDTEDDDPKSKKMKATLVGLAAEITNLQATVAELNKSFADAVTKANAGAAVARETAGHAANATIEANAFVAGANGTTTPAVAETTTEEGVELSKAEENILKTIEAAFSRNLEPVNAKLNSLSAQVEEATTVAKAAADKVETFESTVSNIGENFNSKIVKALEEAEVEAIKQVRVNNIPNAIAPAAQVSKSLTHQDLVNTKMLDAIKRLAPTNPADLV